MLTKRARALVFVFLSSLSGLAAAGVSLISTQAAFSAAGTISQNTNFDWAGPDFTALSNPVTYGDLTIASGDNLVVGTGTDYHPVRPVLAYNGWTPLPGTVAGTHNLFGFNLGYLGQPTMVMIRMSTNLNSYSFTITNPTLASTGLDFWGVQFDSSEYLTSFSLSSTFGVGAAPVITDIQLGVAAVPEPETVFMLLSGLAVIGLARRRRS